MKASLARQLPLSEASIDEIAGRLLARSDLGLPPDEPTAAAQRYIALGLEDVQARFESGCDPKVSCA